MKQEKMLKKNSYSKRIVLLTGSNGQLGKALALELIKNDFLVYGLDIHKKSDLTSADKRKFIYFSVDITSESKVATFFKNIKKDQSEIFALVNNAGIGVFSHFEERTKKDFMKVLEVNLFGTFNMIKNSLNYLSRKNSITNIINISSVYGVVSSDPSIYKGLNRMNAEVYSASKAAVIQITKYFAIHLADRNICVNAISPGGIDNNHPKSFKKEYAKKTPLKRMATVNEIVDAILIFVNNKNQYLTGQNLIIDGGMTSW